MIRLVAISMFSLLTFTSFTAARAEGTVGTYSGCKTLAANESACNACLRGGQFYNFDKTRKKWVCGNTSDMKPSQPVTKPSEKPPINKQPVKPSSVKKR